MSFIKEKIMCKTKKCTKKVRKIVGKTNKKIVLKRTKKINSKKKIGKNSKFQKRGKKWIRL